MWIEKIHINKIIHPQNGSVLYTFYYLCAENYAK